MYRVPKEKERELNVAQGTPAAQPQLQWKTPPGWQEQTPGGMSVASFLIPGGEGNKAQLSVMTFENPFSAREIAAAHRAALRVGFVNLADDNPAVGN